MSNSIISLPPQGTIGWFDWATSVQNHTHTVSDVSDSTAVGRALIGAQDAAAARSAIGASALQLGASSTTAAAGNHTHFASQVTDFATSVRAIMPNIRTVTSSQSLALTDDYVRVSSSSLLTITVPANSTVSFPVGFSCVVRRVSSGGVSLAGASGVTLNGSITGAPQNGSYSLLKVGTDEWDVEGGA
jgi:hypothetical protein